MEPNKVYVAELRVKTATIETPINTSIEISGNNFIKTESASQQGIKFTSSVTAAKAIDDALNSGGYKLLNPNTNVPTGYKYDSSNNAVFVTAAAKGVGSVSVEASDGIAVPSSPQKGLWLGVVVDTTNLKSDPAMLKSNFSLSSTDADNQSINSISALDVDLAQVKRSEKEGVYLDFASEESLSQNLIAIHGSQSVVGDHVVVANKDHSFISFKNSIVEAGNGYNNVMIKEGENGNTFKLGGGGDTIAIYGDNNFVDAGAGTNVFYHKKQGHKLSCNRSRC